MNCYRKSIILLKRLKKLIRQEILDILGIDPEESSAPIYKKARIFMTDVKTSTVYNAIKAHHINTYSLRIQFTSLDRTIGYTHTIEADNPNDFLQRIKSPLDKKYEYFYGLNFCVSFDSKFGNQTVIDILVNSLNNDIYEVSELSEYIKSINDWFNDSPELLI